LAEEQSYILGTHDKELTRLGVQHTVWRPTVLDFWHASGLTQGMTVYDIGAGPGYASFDLCDVVGERGKVVAIEKSQHFIAYLRASVKTRGLRHLIVEEADLFEYDWPEHEADRVWCRWVLSWVTNPQAILNGVARLLREDGKLLIYEYSDYRSWRLAPRSELFEDYIASMISHWQSSGYDPDVGLALPELLARTGLKIESVRPAVFAVQPCDFMWSWPMGFAREYMSTMLKSGALTQSRAAELLALIARYEADASSIMVTPTVLQVVASKSAQRS
jgi:ubiquinone/menaquinone biosynthesis C-methylase UbiE